MVKRISLAVPIFLVGALVLASLARAAEIEVEAHIAPKPICLAARDIGEEIKIHRLLEPFPLLKSAAALYKAEPLGAKLCRIGDDYFYEITLLRHDGRVLRPAVDALSGKPFIARVAQTPSKP